MPLLTIVFFFKKELKINNRCFSNLGIESDPESMVRMAHKYEVFLYQKRPNVLSLNLLLC